jgi:hypothetical protein
MTGATATDGFHAYDSEKGQNVYFGVGDPVPDHIAETVGEHAITRKGKRAAKDAAEAKAAEEAAAAAAAASAPAGDPKINESTNATGTADVYDPGKHNVADVLKYLETADPAESERVREAERAGQGRVTILGD